ncbi:hypothetical protein APASM_1384 [Actinosynnema pretiosum subsp. pretiosum]|nr:hypothetical protein APASM_1384 [Actinosynnema pretiosum subsp. pretiosum]
MGQVAAREVPARWPPLKRGGVHSFEIGGPACCAPGGNAGRHFCDDGVQVAHCSASPVGDHGLWWTRWTTALASHGRT